ncbi:hypothetical protein T484DRAFT_1969949, partial [Baffinella frigidus]
AGPSLLEGTSASSSTLSTSSSDPNSRPPTPPPDFPPGESGVDPAFSPGVSGVRSRDREDREELGYGSPGVTSPTRERKELEAQLLESPSTPARVARQRREARNLKDEARNLSDEPRREARREPRNLKEAPLPASVSPPPGQGQAFRDLFMNLSSGTGGSLYESVNSKSVNSSAGGRGGSREGTPFDPDASGVLSGAVPDTPPTNNPFVSLEDPPGPGEGSEGPGGGSEGPSTPGRATAEGATRAAPALSTSMGLTPARSERVASWNPFDDDV